ncbi:DUF4153 domain-containing protein [Azohydromonas australica]|uniref:DUF4153 domain-containing protein n=1 Tax=Azohydromonas australica TaxID=364039 RepID=UPI0012EB725A|nr:DUF4153 domain-containing protein [Azohydromonas australica]
MPVAVIRPAIANTPSQRKRPSDQGLQTAAANQKRLYFDVCSPASAIHQHHQIQNVVLKLDQRHQLSMPSLTLSSATQTSFLEMADIGPDGSNEPPVKVFQAKRANYGWHALLISHLAVGAVTGLVLWALTNVSASLPAEIVGACLYMTIATALGWLLSHDAYSSAKAKAIFAILLGLAFGLLGAHAGLATDDGGKFRPPLGHMLAALVVGFITLSLAAGWRQTIRRFDYPILFQFAWRNALLILLSCALTGLLWVLSVAAAWLMESIGIRQFNEILVSPAFRIILTASALGLSTGLVLILADTTSSSISGLLSLISWFLPLAQAFAIIWMVALLITGVEPLFATRSAAFYLLWFALLAITFVNAAFQDGRKPPVYPPFLASVLRAAWITLPVLCALACWALAQRVQQHGWTQARIWAAVVALLITMHAVGYVISLVFRRRAWMATIAPTNVAAALLEVALVTALISPIADVRMLAANDQVARLQAGKVKLAEFDWQYLAREQRYGRPALEALATQQGSTSYSKDLAARAKQALNDIVLNPNIQNTAKTKNVKIENVVVLPVGAKLPPDLVHWLTKTHIDWNIQACLSQPEKCVIWLTDVNADAQQEALLLCEEGSGVLATIYGKNSSGWRKEARVIGSQKTISAWRAAIEAGQTRLVAPRWPDLMIGDERLEVIEH